MSKRTHYNVDTRQVLESLLESIYMRKSMLLADVDRLIKLIESSSLDMERMENLALRNRVQRAREQLEKLV